MQQQNNNTYNQSPIGQMMPLAAWLFESPKLAIIWLYTRDEKELLWKRIDHY